MEINKGMFKKALFSILWSVVFYLVSCCLVGACLGVLVFFLIAAGMDDEIRKPILEFTGNLSYGICILAGLAGLVLGILGKLPHTGNTKQTYYKGIFQDKDSYQKAMVKCKQILKKALFAILWSFAFEIITAFIIGLCLGFQFSRLAASGMDEQAAKTIAESTVRPALVVCMLAGLVGLVLGILGKLPGTRRIAKQTGQDPTVPAN